LGLKALGTGFSVRDLMRLGDVAQTGLDADGLLLAPISDLMSWVWCFETFIQIVGMISALPLNGPAFLILAVQLFITLIEFRLTTLVRIDLTTLANRGDAQAGPMLHSLRRMA